jgi:hypothetical protein
MKKLLVISLLALGLVFATSPAYSQSGVQIDVGAALQGYSTTTVTAGPGGISSSSSTQTDIGARAGIKYPFSDKMALSGNFTLFFPENGSLWAIDANFLYNLVSKSTFNFYGFAGPNLTNQSVGGFSNSEFGVNLGTGIEFGQSVNFYLEPKYTLSNFNRFEIAGGVRFAL